MLSWLIGLCISLLSVGNKAATMCHIITDEHLDILAITETWYECFESTVLKRVTPPGYNCIDAARLMPPDMHRDTVEFQNHGGLAFVFIKFRKRDLDVSITMFEYLCRFCFSQRPAHCASRRLPAWQPSILRRAVSGSRAAGCLRMSSRRMWQL